MNDCKHDAANNNGGPSRDYGCSHLSSVRQRRRRFRNTNQESIAIDRLNQNQYNYHHTNAPVDIAANTIMHYQNMYQNVRCQCIFCLRLSMYTAPIQQMNSGYNNWYGFSNSPPMQNMYYAHTLQRSYSDSLLQHNALKTTYMFRDETNSDLAITRKSSGDLNASDYYNDMGRDRENLQGIRTWELTSLGRKLEIANSEPPGLVFTLMSYNVLSQSLLSKHQYLYKHHHPVALRWKTRWENLLQEITTHDADIICLQEVEAAHINDNYSQLSKLGYQQIYKQRTNDLEDGCAIYYKPSVFNLIEYTTVEFQQYNIPALNRDNVAIVARFSPKNDPENEFVVATTHLLYNPRRQDVRLAQTQVLLAEVDRLSFKKGQNIPNNHLPVIITGDFNSEPDSVVVELITNGELHYKDLANRTLLPTNTSTTRIGNVFLPSTLRITDNCQHADLLPHRTANANIPRDQELEIIQLMHSERKAPEPKNVSNETLFSTGTLTHDFNLKSVHNFDVGNDTEGTTFQSKWITVDYLFYSDGTRKQKSSKDNKLQLVSRFSVPTTRQLQKVKYIPNFVLGSDHLALLAKFKLVYNKNKSKI